MSRTEGVHLPRLPEAHARVTSSAAMRPHAAASSSLRATTRRRSLTEPSYTAYVGTPRQDIPHPVFSDAAMYDDVFDKEGRLLSGRNTAKFTSPLNTVGYNSLNDPHCQKLFLNNRRLRSHLIDLGLITDDLKVVATTTEQRQKIRAHELLERKELLAQKLDHREKERLQRLVSQPFRLPQIYQDSNTRHQHRREQWSRIQEIKTQKIIKQQEQERAERAKRVKQKKAELAKAMNEARLQEQAHRNALRVQQEIAEITAYEKAYGKNAHWHREADKINNRMIAMQLQWSKNKKQQKRLSESFPPISQSQSRRSSQVAEFSQELERVAGKVVTISDKTRAKGGGPAETKVAEGERVGEGERGRDKAQEKRKQVEAREEEERVESPKPTAGKSESEQKTPREVEHQKRDEEEEYEEQVAPDRIEPVMKETTHPPTHSHTHTPQDTTATAAEQKTIVVEEGEQGSLDLTRILTEAFYSIEGERGSGYLTVEDFLQVLVSRDLGLQLADHEQSYVISQVDPSFSGVVGYLDVAPILPDLLSQIFTQRAEQSIQYYGYNVEEKWIQMYPVSGGVVYLNKLTGRVQAERPEEFRPYLKDEVFEDSLVDFFETADTDRDGLIDYDDFYNLLASPEVASRVYRSQMSELLALYQTQTGESEGRMDLASFSNVANPLLLMIYQNAYPDVEDWIELESKKFGGFWLNKRTGEIRHEPPTVPVTPSVVVGGEREAEEKGRPRENRLRRKKKHKKRSIADSELATDSTPPKLVPRPKSRPTSQQNITSDTPPADQDILPHSSSPVNEEEVLQQEVIKPVSSRSRLIGPATFETIPEEDETALSLEDSSVARGEFSDEITAVKSEEDADKVQEEEEGKEEAREEEKGGKDQTESQRETEIAAASDIPREDESQNLEENTVTASSD